LLAIIEASVVTGPAKNLLAFCQSAASHNVAEYPLVETKLVTFQRVAAHPPVNQFVESARSSAIPIEVIAERFRFDSRVIDDLRRIVADYQPDLVQTHSVKSHFLCRAAKLWQSHRWIAFHHGYTTTDWKMWAYNQLDRWSLRKADRVVTMNQPFAEYFKKIGVRRERLGILHNAVDGEAISNVNRDEVQQLKARLKISGADKTILAVGRLSAEKGHVDLINAFAGLRQWQPDLPVKLLLVGEGTERANLEKTIAMHGIGERVLFAGQVSDARPFYALADVLVLPSHSEGSPNVLLEAMAAGVACVATRVGGVPEIATNEENALLVNAGDAAGMATAMQRLLCDEELGARLVAQAKSRVLQHHSPEARLRSLLKMYTEVVPNRIEQAMQTV